MRCEHCRKILPKRSYSSRRFCSSACRKKSFLLRRALARVLASQGVATVYKRCPVCGRWFQVPAASALRLYDTRYCQQRAASMRRAARAAGLVGGIHE